MLIVSDLVATSASSILANVVTHPFEMLKTQQQMHGVSMSSLVRSHGLSLSWLYRGFSASLARAVISGGGRQTIYFALKGDERKGVARPVVGGISGLLAALVAAPVDMARTRQQLSSSSSLGGTLLDAWRSGGARELWKGSSAVLLRQILLTGAQLPVYDASKEHFSLLFSLPPSHVGIQALSASVAGAAATVAVAPAETIKTHMQAARGGPRSSLASSFVSFVSLHGAPALWRGSFALWLKLAPHTLIVMLGTDLFRQLLH